MKKATKILAMFLSVVLLSQGVFSASAAFDDKSLTQEEWDSVYENLIDENTLPTLCVGADETQLNICWHAAKDKAVPKVRLADNKAMANAKVFEGETTPAENENQLVCRVTMTGIEENSTYYYQWYSESGWSEAYKYESKCFDSITIEKTKDFSDGKLRVGIRSLFYKLVELLGLAYMKIDAVIVEMRGGHF